MHLSGSALLLVAGVLLAADGARAQAYPDRPVRVLVGFSPGGTVDVPTRIVANKLGPVLGGSVVVENKPGAGGSVAASQAAKAVPDGYTLHACGSASHTMGPAVYSRLPYDPVKDFVPISMIGTVPNVLLIHPSVPAANLREFLGYAKANPGKVRALAVTTPRRSAQLPDVPTVAESGVPGYDVTSWLGLCAPAGVPPAIVAKLARDLHAVLKLPDTQARLAEQGYDVVTSTPDELQAYLRTEIPKWTRVVKEAGITAE